MSNESSRDKGPKRTDENEETPVLGTSMLNHDDLASPPPSLDPSSSSSSSSNPAVQHTPCQPAVPSNQEGAADLSVAAQFAQLFSVVTRLSAQNEAQESAIARLSSENNSLRSEVASLRRTLQDQDRVLADVSKAAIPGGHWIWEGGGEGGRDGPKAGRWLYSLEKYRVLPPLAVVATGPPASLESLPNELLSLILEHLNWSDELALCGVSFRLLEVASQAIYRGNSIQLDCEDATLFVNARVLDISPKNSRIGFLLLPNRVTLEDDLVLANSFDATVKLASRWTSSISPVPVNGLKLAIDDISLFTTWSRILPFFNPKMFRLNTKPEDQQHLSPTVHFFPLQSITSFTVNWTHLSRVEFLGASSVLLVEGSEDELAFEDCLRRCCPSSVHPLQSYFWTRMHDGTQHWTEVGEPDVPSITSHPFHGDGSEKYVAFCVEADGGGEEGKRRKRTSEPMR